MTERSACVPVQVAMNDEYGSSLQSKSLPTLVVDDNPVDQRLAAIHLGEVWPFQKDLELDFASDCSEALAKLRARRFALLVLDWKPPGQNGGDVLRDLREQGIHIPVVILSVLSREGLQADLEEFGVAYLSKDNLNATSFLQAITDALTRRDLTISARR